MTTSSMISTVDAFVANQNTNRGLAGEEVSLDYDALTGAVPVGGNAVTGISGIAAGAGAISLAGAGTVILDGAVGASASVSGPDNYAFSVDSSGKVTVQDVNSGASQTITGANYLIFDNAATTSTGAFQSAYFIESGINASIAALYAAALGREPDLAGMEYYVNRIADGEQTLVQQAASFLASPEFTARFPTAAAAQDNGGTNDQAFITQLYQNMLHRTESASELAWYVNDIQTNFGGVQNYRAILLADFATSPENQSDLSGWLINPANGGSGSTATLTATALETATTIDTSTLPTLTAGSYGSGDSANTVMLIGAGITGGSGSSAFTYQNTLVDSHDGLTITLSSNINDVVALGNNDTINGFAGGNSVIHIPSSNPSGLYNNHAVTVNLFGTGNIIWAGGGGGAINETSVAVINGFAVGDKIIDPNINAAYVGATTAFVNVGTVSADTAAAMAAAANKVYTVKGTLAESVIFYGQDVSGNTLVAHWDSNSAVAINGVVTYTAGADQNHNGLVDATEFMAIEKLIGIAATSITTSMFAATGTY